MRPNARRFPVATTTATRYSLQQARCPRRLDGGESMLSLSGTAVRLCEGLTRREWLRAGGLGAFGLALPDLLRARASAASVRPMSSFGRARSCIVAFLFGAPAHQ